MNLDPTILEYVSRTKMSGSKNKLRLGMKTHFLGPWAVGTGKGTGHHVLFSKYWVSNI